MSLTDEERQQVINYRIEKALKTLDDAKKVIELQMWVAGANRYAAYYAVSALLIANGLNAKTHEGIIRMFNLLFVNTEKIGTTIQYFIYNAFDWRLRRLF
ncbi:MAG: HEPN domain-containing protein [Clostridia bacterium]|nr:HEPN domain-containing protein [Clostridia bacterium]